MDNQKQGRNLTQLSGKEIRISIILGVLLAICGVAMFIIGIFYGVGYLPAGDPAARWLLFGCGVGGAVYIFVRIGKAVQRAWD